MLIARSFVRLLDNINNRQNYKLVLVQTTFVNSKKLCQLQLLVESRALFSSATRFIDAIGLMRLMDLIIVSNSKFKIANGKWNEQKSNRITLNEISSNLEWSSLFSACDHFKSDWFFERALKFNPIQWDDDDDDLKLARTISRVGFKSRFASYIWIANGI